MIENRVLLNVTRFRQRPGECAIATASSIANYYNKNIIYSHVRRLVPHDIRGDGLYSSQQGRLLNKLGFNNVRIVTADLTMVDFSWRNMKKSTIIKKIKKLIKYYKKVKDENGAECVRDLVDWLSDEKYDNDIIIDYDFAKYIKRELNQGRPVSASVNWTSLWKFKKAGHSNDGDITGDQESHAIVIRGYDDDGVFVVDSHTQCYKGSLEKFRRGYYKLSWHKFLVNISTGDLILAC